MKEVKETLGRTIVHFNDCDYYFAHVTFRSNLSKAYILRE